MALPAIHPGEHLAEELKALHGSRRESRRVSKGVCGKAGTKVRPSWC